MKKKLALLSLMATMATVGYGASIDHIQTYAPEYLGNQALTGMINNTSVYYNPAGLVNLQEGTYLHGGMELAVGHEKMNYDGKDYKAKLLQPIPNFAAYKVEKDSALYWTFGGLGGGGDLKYKDGVAGTAVVPGLINNGQIMIPADKLKSNPMIAGGLAAGKLQPTTLIPTTIPNVLGIDNLRDTGSSAEGKNLYIQSTLGKSWNVNDKLSLSLGGRIVYGVRELKANINVAGDAREKNIYRKAKGELIGFEANMDSKRTAWGYGFQLGLNYKATDRLNLAARYDSRIKLNFKAKGDIKNAVLGPNGELGALGFGNFYPEYVPGTKARRDMPAILALGASYKVTDNWTTALAGNFYFNKQAKMDNVVGKLAFTNAKEVKAKYKNGWELAFGNEYRFSPKWAWLGSINYAHTGAKVESFDDVEYALNSITLGTGLKYNPNDSTEWVFSVSHFFYQEKSGNYNIKYNGMSQVDNPKYDKSITAFGVSYTQRF